MKVRYRLEARLDIEQIYEYIASRNPHAASNVLRRIRDSIELLREFPHIGHEGRVPDTREWVVKGLPYVVVHELHPDRETLMILAVLHGARDREP